MPRTPPAQTNGPADNVVVVVVMAGDVGFASSNQQYAEQDGKMTPSNMAVGRLPDWNSKVC